MPSPGPLAPGLAVALAGAALLTLLTAPIPALSPLVPAIVLGVLLANTLGVPARWRPGLAVAARHLLRAGIVLLGLSLVVGDLLALGPGVLLAATVVVVGGITGTLALGRALGVPARLRLLIACGFSICGAAAVAATAAVTDPDGEHEEDTVTALALVVLCGSAMILLLPLAAGLLSLPERTAGLWAGGAIHEVAQVVAAGGVLGTGALTVAVLVKLARVLLLAPVTAVLAVHVRRRARADGVVDGEGVPGEGVPGQDAARGRGRRLPPIVPPFVLGFLALVAVRSLVPVPGTVVDGAELLRTLLLTAAMFALGSTVRIRSLLALGPRPLVLAGGSTALVAGLALGGVLLAA